MYSIILPTYNERDNLPLLVWMIDKYLAARPTSSTRSSSWTTAARTAPRRRPNSWPKSTARTAFVLAAAAARKLGLGTRLSARLEACQRRSRDLMDADLSHHPKFIPQMVAKMRSGSFDIVTGSRYEGEGCGVYGWDLRRKVISRGANFLAQLLLRPGDLTGSFRLYKREVLQRLVDSCTSKGYVFQMEMMVRARHLGYSIGEVPITLC
uniref:Dolichol-phosphate mannosyltransferase subunit 1 n=1 Tax=Macrostomum lignano TaxID=282301 RepID=A0A1I8F6U5_9PLAT